MKKTSQRSLLFRQNVNRTEAEWRRGYPCHGGRGMRTRLRPRRRAVDRAAIGNRHIIWQLTPCGKVAGDIGIVGLWKCGIMRLWNYGIGSRRFQFQNSVMAHFHNCTISQSISPAACGYDACCKYTRQFFGFVNEWTKLADLNIFGLPDYLEPNACLRKLFHGNLELVDEILARFGFCCFCIIRCNAGGSTEQLVCKTAAADSLLRQRSAYLYTACSKFYNSILKFVFCHASALLQSHNSTISYFHNFTISQFITVVKIEPINVDIYFHCLENAKAGLSPGLAPPRQCLGGWLEGIVPNIFSWRNGVTRQSW